MMARHQSLLPHQLGLELWPSPAACPQQLGETRHGAEEAAGILIPQGHLAPHTSQGAPVEGGPGGAEANGSGCPSPVQACFLFSPSGFSHLSILLQSADTTGVDFARCSVRP